METLLVLDATTGQNALNQAREFKEAAGITGIILTKLDGTAKGGIVIAVKEELGVPVQVHRGRRGAWTICSPLTGRSLPGRCFCGMRRSCFERQGGEKDLWGRKEC